MKKANFESGARSSNVLVVTGPGKLLLFAFKMEVSIVLQITWWNYRLKKQMDRFVGKDSCLHSLDFGLNVWFRNRPMDLCSTVSLSFPPSCKGFLHGFVSVWGISFRGENRRYLGTNIIPGFIKKIATVFKGLFKDHIRFSRMTTYEEYKSQIVQKCTIPVHSNRDLFKAWTVCFNKFSTIFISLVLNW